MSTLQQVRDMVRNQMDLDSIDLPDSILDNFIKEGFNRTFALERRWPFFQHTWTLTLPTGNTTIAMPTSPTAEVDSILRLRNPDGTTMVRLAHREAEDAFSVEGTGEPVFYSVWGDSLYLWPTPSSAADRIYTMRGYRKPTFPNAGTTEMDGDERLHTAIFHYATSLAYAQLEDPEQSAQYLQRWAQVADAIRRDVMEPDSHEPAILNGGIGTWPSRRVTLNLTGL